MIRMRIVWGGVLGCLFVGAILLNPFQNSSASVSLNSIAAISGTTSSTGSTFSATPTEITPTMHSIFAPLIGDNIGISPIELNQVWNTDGKGNRQNAFLSGNEMRFYSLGYSRVMTDSIHITWDQAGPCGSNRVFSGTVQVNPGVWQTYQTSTAPDCIGVYTNTLQFAYKQYTDTLSANFVVDPPSLVIHGDQQGFDRCNIPSISDMQTWWYQSPYYTINLYIGGSLSHCSNQDLTPEWVQEVAKQGWTFIPTWVGPQAPCSSFRERISYDPQISSQQGKLEADAAVKASNQIGLLGGSIIYYDVESYIEGINNSSCRNAMSSFLSGWTKGLHALGYRSGAYGSSYSSYIKDWALISPTPDDIWMARWQVPYQYDQNATVLGDPYVSDTLWPNHRIRQYAGDHIETWGKVSLAIDSDVIDGEITFLPVTSTQQTGTTPAITTPNTILTVKGIQVQDMQALQNELGWFLTGDHLLWRDARNSTWGQSELPLQKNETILDLNFQNDKLGWLASQNVDTGEIAIYGTVSSRGRWKKISSLQPEGPVSQASFSFIDNQTGWLALRLQSSSNFNLGQLFRTTDGGHSWIQLPIPTGGVIRFVDSQHGWVEGGASGDELFSTNDGGYSWTRAAGNVQGYQTGTNEPVFPNSASSDQATVFDNLPGTILNIQFSDPMTGWALIQQSTCTGEKKPLQLENNAPTASFQCTSRQLLFETRDGGRTWAQLPL
jgi:photosystem II stability/assembly factor-like uncharacterized protein